MEAVLKTDSPRPITTADLLRQLADLSSQTKTLLLEWNTLLVTTQDENAKERLIGALVLLEDTGKILANAFSDLDVSPELPFDRLSEVSYERLAQYETSPGWSAAYTRQQHLLAGISSDLAHAALIGVAGVRIEIARLSLKAAIQFLAHTSAGH